MTDTPVAKEVWRPFSGFKKGRELVELAYDCFLTHKQAVENAKILHRNISAGNMLIYEYMTEGKVKRRGLLVDWELSKPLDFQGKSQFERTGTWQFVSALALEDLKWSVGTPDDLESFLHVILWHAIRFIPSNCIDNGAFMTRFFDEAEYDGTNPFGGFAKRQAMERGYILVGGGRTRLRLIFHTKAESSRPHNLTAFIPEMLKLFKARYMAYQEGDLNSQDYESAVTEMLPPPLPVRAESSSSALRGVITDHRRTEPSSGSVGSTSPALVQHDVQNHQAMDHTFKRFLAKTVSWPDDDKTEDQLPPDFDYFKSQKYLTTYSTRLDSIPPVGPSNDPGPSNDSGPSTKRQKISGAKYSPLPPSNAVAGPSGTTPAPATKANGKRTPGQTRASKRK